MTFRNDSPLLSLIDNKNNEEAKTFIKNENLYNAVDSKKNTLLHYAALYGNPEIVQFLIDSGSEVNAENDVEQTPLCKSLHSDPPCAKVVDILLGAGADIYVYDHGYMVCEIVNEIYWLNDDIKRYEILKVIIERTLAIDDTIYIFFLHGGDEEAMKLLLETNIDLYLANNNGKNLIHYLAVAGKPGMIEQLHGRNYEVDVRDNGDWTPLMYAAAEGNISAMEFLLKEGADVEAMEMHYGRTALYIAFDSDCIASSDVDEVVQFLLEHGANAQVETSICDRETIFDLFFRYISEFSTAELLLAHLALQEQLGTTITDLIRDKINSHPRFKSFFEDCRQQLSVAIYPRVTLFDVLTANERRLERYLRNETFASELRDWMQKGTMRNQLESEIGRNLHFRYVDPSLISSPTKMDYYNKILGKRIPKAARMVELRRAAGIIICKLYKMDYESYPYIADEIVSYLEEKDINCLLQVKL